MEVTLLGPLQAWENGRLITPTANKHRQLFALLAIRSGELVPAWELIDELWEDKAPPSTLRSPSGAQLFVQMADIDYRAPSAEYPAHCHQWVSWQRLVCAVDLGENCHG